MREPEIYESGGARKGEAPEAKVNVMNEYVLEMLHITKEFPGVKALSDVTVRLKKGEVLALLGENGAGKSTLIKILAGVYPKDQGQIIISGGECDIKDPLEAKKHGIGVIFQELCLVPEMTIAENIFLGREPASKLKSLVDYKYMYNSAQRILNEFGLQLSARTRIGELSIAQQQMIEIIKAVSFDADIIVMDEPTSSLSQKEVTMLFGLIKTLKQKQISIIYISHRMEEIFTIADRVTVLRDGAVVGTREIGQTTSDELVTMMVGRTLDSFYIKSKHATPEMVLEVRGLRTAYSKHEINFELYRGEILGISGLVGAGRSEVARALFGVDRKIAGTIRIEGREVSIQTPEDAIREGLALVPENRKEEGLVLQNQVGYNLSLLVLNEFIHGVRIDQGKEKGIIRRAVEGLSIKTYSAKQEVSNLSGGNQQKIVIGKWLAATPKILILDEPTRGIDVGAKTEIYTIMNDLTSKGVSIIMISSELPEILNMSDRIMVMAEGKVTGLVSQEDFTQETIMRYAINR